MASRKPSISIKRTKNGIQIIQKMYDDFGNVIKRQVESVNK